jgi:radical SAM protein with 4Fe4S-binding SPASM domain
VILDLPQTDLFQRLERRAVPVMAHLHLTEKCNLECLHCYRIGLPVGGEMNGAEWVRILDEIRAEGALDLTFSGGEPFLHPEWRTVMGEAARMMFRFEIFQNGTVITPQDIEFLAGIGIKELSFSIHGVDDVHDRFVKKSGAFARAWPMVSVAVAAGIKTVVKMSVMRPTFPSIGALAELTREAGAIFAPSYYIIPRFVPGHDEFLAERLTPTEIRECESRYREWTGRAEFSACFDEDDKSKTMCNMGWSRFAIGPLGDLYPCSQVPESVGNVRHTPFRDVWRNSRRLNEIRMQKGKAIEGCSSCGISSKCKYRCMGHFKQSTGHYDKPAPEHCEITAAWFGLDLPAEPVLPAAAGVESSGSRSAEIEMGKVAA